MRTKISSEGLLIPKDWFDGIDEVEIQKEAEMIKIIPMLKHDPIFDIGKNPVTIDVDDAAINHDRYLCE